MFLKKIIRFFITVIFFNFINVALATDFVAIEGSGHTTRGSDAVYLKALVDSTKIPKELNVQSLRYKWTVFPYRNIVPLNAKEIFFVPENKQGKYTVILDVIGVLETKKPFHVFTPENTEVNNPIVIPEGEESPVDSVITKTDILVVDPILYEVEVSE